MGLPMQHFLLSLLSEHVQQQLYQHVNCPTTHTFHPFIQFFLRKKTYPFFMFFYLLLLNYFGIK